MLNLLYIPFLLLLTHPQALSLRLQPELLGHNTITGSWDISNLVFGDYWSVNLLVDS